MTNEQSSIQEEVTQLKSVITKTIENNNENVKEVERELEMLENDRRAATEQVILTEAFNGDNGFVPIIETFSEDDAIVIKPKSTNDAIFHGNGNPIEDMANRHGKLAAIAVNNEQDNKMPATVSIVSTAKHADKSNNIRENSFNEFDDNDGDDVTISLDGLKVRIPSTSRHKQFTHAHLHTHTNTKHLLQSVVLFD